MSHHIINLICLLGALVFLVYFHNNYQATIKSSQNYIMPPEFKHFTFGYSELIADSLWIRALQDFDYCENKKTTAAGKRTVDCVDDGWLYHMLDSITDLAPKFRIAYAVGAMTLSVTVSDISGASKLFDKAVRQFPEDWPILYRAGYHALFEEKNKPKAADLLLRSVRHGGPKWLYSLAGGIYGEAGQMEFAERLLQELKDSGADQRIVVKFEEKIKLLKSKM